MNWIDGVRVFGFLMLGFAIGQAIFINVRVWEARRLLVPPPLLLAWHVTAVTIYSIGFHIKAAIEHFVYFGEMRATWRLPIFIFLGVVGNVSLALIRKVTEARVKVDRTLAKALEDE